MLMRRTAAVVAEIARFEWGYPHLTLPYGPLELRGLKRRLLKFTFNAENFTRRLSWSIAGDLGAIHS